MEKHAKPHDSEEKKGFSFDPKKSGQIESYTVKEGDTLDWIGVAAGVSATILAVMSGRVNRTW